MIASAPQLPPIYSTKRYQIGAKNRIEVLTYTRWPGTTREQLHPDAQEHMFLGYSVIRAYRPDGKHLPREVCFPIAATTIFEAVKLFDEHLKKVLEDLNKPDIALPPGMSGNG